MLLEMTKFKVLSAGSRFDSGMLLYRDTCIRHNDFSLTVRGSTQHEDLSGPQSQFGYYTSYISSFLNIADPDIRRRLCISFTWADRTNY